jgi:hypothetical protein
LIGRLTESAVGAGVGKRIDAKLGGETAEVDILKVSAGAEHNPGGVGAGEEVGWCCGAVGVFILLAIGEGDKQGGVVGSNTRGTTILLISIRETCLSAGTACWIGWILDRGTACYGRSSGAS